jgi:TetR/AcrR family transcriptional regulator, transcriptional repressor for nem operon
MPGAEIEPATPKGRRTRLALLEAGAVVAERLGLAGLSVAAVTEQAGLAKGTFYLYFADRETFIDAMHQRFYQRVSEAVADAVQGLTPGSRLLLSAIDAYLDVCLENRAVKALVLETRAQGELSTTMEQREKLFAALAQPSLEAMGMVPAPVAARLFVAMTSETALIEMEAGHEVPGAREVIRALAKARRA